MRTMNTHRQFIALPSAEAIERCQSSAGVSPAFLVFFSKVRHVA